MFDSIHKRIFRALPGNPVIFVMISWMYNNAKDVKTEIDNTLRVSAPLRPCVKLENNNAKVQRRDGAKNKSPRVYFTGIFGCAIFRQIKAIRRRFAQTAGLLFNEILSTETILDIMDEEVDAYRDRIFSPLITLSAFLSQVLSGRN